MRARLFIITGGPGSGKTSIIDELAARGHAVTREVGRRIIQDEMVLGGMALPWKDRAFFAERMLTAEIENHSEAIARGRVTFCDRGVPDVAGYLDLEGLPVPAHVEEAVRTFAYERTVFICPPWPEIFHQDRERKQSLYVAKRTFEAMRRTYSRLGYELIALPRAPVSERVETVLRIAGL